MKYSNIHTHTTFSDGKNTPEEMIERAKELGFVSLGFSDHSETVFDPHYCMASEKYSLYRSKISELKEKEEKVKEKQEKEERKEKEKQEKKEHKDQEKKDHKKTEVSPDLFEMYGAVRGDLTSCGGDLSQKKTG